MKALRIILISILATSCMTLFSYIMSAIMKENFREPYLLKQIMQLEIPIQGNTLTFFEGWFIHYFVGLIFVWIYTMIWRNDSLYPDTTTGFLLGTASGIVAIFCWAIVFTIFHNLIQADLIHYYLQLVIAHIIFGLCAVQAYRATTQSPSGPA